MLAGAIQGIAFTVVVLLSKKYRSESNFYLLALIAVFSFNILEYYSIDTGLISRNTFYRYLYIPVANLVPVFLYFYTLKLIYPEKKITAKQKFLYFPFVFWMVVFFVYKILVIFYPEIFPKNYSILGILLYLHELNCSLFIMLMALYGLRKVLKFEKSKKNNQNPRTKPQLLWLKFFLFSIFIFLFLFWIYAAYADINQIEPNYYFLWIVMAIQIYCFGHIGIYKFGINEEREQIRNYSFSTKKPIEKIKISDTVNKNIPGFVKFIVEDKNYMDSSLTLEKTADNLNLSPSYLSRIINQEMGITFTDFVNKKRVEEAASYLTNPEFSNYTLVAIGLEAGFNSKSAFNSSFKKITGKTPGEFRKELLTTADRSDAFNFEFSNEN